MKVAIIGAGASGLTAIKCCLDESLEPTCFERNNDIGGLWRLEEGTKHGATVYRSTVINTSKELMCYSDFPLPKECPNFMHHTRLQEYYRQYAKRFNLQSRIQFNREVISCTPKDGKWILNVRNTETCEECQQTFKGVMVAVGHHAEPHYPLEEFSGLQKFSGKVQHSHDYRDFKGFEEKNVLVIGMGNSGVDIAVELSWHAKQVYLSTRKGAWVFSRVGPYGMPVDFYGMTRFRKLLKDYTPEKWTRDFLEGMLNQKFDHAHYGLRPEHGPLNQHSTMNDDLPNRVINGSLKIKSNVREFTEGAALFDDGSREAIDCVILATGYKFSFPFLPESVLKVEETKCNLYKYMWPMTHSPNNLAVIGHIQAFGAVNPISELQCRWATRVFKGEAALPSKSEMLKDVEDKREKMRKRFYASRRHSIEVDHIDYMDQIAEQIGVKPNLLKMFFTDYQLAKKLLYEVSSPYQYRLSGPGRHKEARNLIMTQKGRMLCPLHTRAVPKRKKKSSPIYGFFKIVASAVFVYFLFHSLRYLS